MAKLSTPGRNAVLDNLLALLNVGGLSGSLVILTGTAPTHCSDADSGTQLASLALSVTSFAASAAGSAASNTISSDVDCDATGTAGYWRLKSSAGTVILQGTCGTVGAEINFDSTSIVQHGTLSCSGITVTCPEGT